MTRRLAPLLALPALLLTAEPAAAQEEPEAGIGAFVRQVAWLWGLGDAVALVDLVADHDALVLDTGRGTATVNARHAAAALRDLFEGRATDSARAVRASLAGGSPPRGFGEVAWTFHARGAPAPHTRSIFVAATWVDDAWRIIEIRVMR